MAKLKMPLGSLGASGQIGKALVYFPWKGLNVVREHVVPANPKSTAQQAQRTLFTAAVTEFHGALYTALDMTAWARLAGTIKAAMTGFNAMVQAHVKEGILANTWTRLHHVTTSAVAATGFNPHVIKAAGGDAPTVHYGTRATFMPDSAEMTGEVGDSWGAELEDLTPDTLYYFYITVGESADDYARTGIYTQRTSKA